MRSSFLAVALDDVLVLVAVPDVADGDRGDALVLLLQLVDDVEVGLAAAADAEEGDADALVGAVDAAGAGRGQRQGRGPGGSGLEEIATIHVTSGHYDNSSH